MGKIKLLIINKLTTTEMFKVDECMTPAFLITIPVNSSLENTWKAPAFSFAHQRRKCAFCNKNDGNLAHYFYI